MNDSRLTPAAHGLALDARLLPHEKLDVFEVAVELVDLVAKLPHYRGTYGASDQLRRAAALRVLCALRGLSDAQHQAGRSLCQRLYAMLTKLCRKA